MLLMSLSWDPHTHPWATQEVAGLLLKHISCMDHGPNLVCWKAPGHAGCSWSPAHLPLLLTGLPGRSWDLIHHLPCIDGPLYLALPTTVRPVGPCPIAESNPKCPLHPYPTSSSTAAPTCVQQELCNREVGVRDAVVKSRVAVPVGQVDHRLQELRPDGPQRLQVGCDRLGAGGLATRHPEPLLADGAEDMTLQTPPSPYPRALGEPKPAPRLPRCLMC